MEGDTGPTGTSNKSCCKPWCTPFWGVLSAVLGVALVTAPFLSLPYAALLSFCGGHLQVVFAIVAPPMIRNVVDTKLCDQLCIPEPKDANDPNYWSACSFPTYFFVL
jgi:hypothetical protein